MIGINDHVYTLNLIRQNKEFVIANQNSPMAKQTLSIGATHEHYEDKGNKFSLELGPTNKVDVLLLANSVVNIECRSVMEYCPGKLPLGRWRRCRRRSEQARH